MIETYGTEWLLPEAPSYREERRYCERSMDECITAHQCGQLGRLSGYTGHLGSDNDPVYLCNLCDRARAGKDPYSFVGRKRKGAMRTTAYPLKNLRKYRKKANLTQAQLAYLAECGTPHIMEIELGRVNCSSKLAGRIAKALGREIRTLRGI